MGVGFDRIEKAYALAEHHRDWSTLVHLCHNPVSAKGEGKIQALIEQYGQDFAFVLYRWYIDSGGLGRASSVE